MLGLAAAAQTPTKKRGGPKPPSVELVNVKPLMLRLLVQSLRPTTGETSIEVLKDQTQVTLG